MKEMKKMSRRPIWVTDLDAEVLLGYVGELIDSFNDSSMSNFDRTVLVSVYTQLTAMLDLNATHEEKENE
jgi:hypothetical protein